MSRHGPTGAPFGTYRLNASGVPSRACIVRSSVSVTAYDAGDSSDGGPVAAPGTQSRFSVPAPLPLVAIAGAQATAHRPTTTHNGNTRPQNNMRPLPDPPERMIINLMLRKP